MPPVLYVGIAARVVQHAFHLQVVKYPVPPVQRGEGVAPGNVCMEVVRTGYRDVFPVFVNAFGLLCVQFKLQVVPSVVEFQGQDVVFAELVREGCVHVVERVCPAYGLAVLVPSVHYRDDRSKHRVHPAPSEGQVE